MSAYFTDPTAYYSRHEMELMYGSPIEDDEPTVVSFGYPKWYGDYVFEDRNEGKDFAEFWNAEII